MQYCFLVISFVVYLCLFRVSLFLIVLVSSIFAIVSFLPAAADCNATSIYIYIYIYSCSYICIYIYIYIYSYRKFYVFLRSYCGSFAENRGDLRTLTLFLVK